MVTPYVAPATDDINESIMRKCVLLFHKDERSMRQKLKKNCSSLSLTRITPDEYSKIEKARILTYFTQCKIINIAHVGNHNQILFMFNNALFL